MSHFIPPFSLGGFKPSPATISEFIYQIWFYLQQNPIMPENEIKQEIADTIPPAVKNYVENNPEMAESIAEIVNEYLVENPPEAPVQSVNSQTGDVVIDYKSLVPSNIQIPVFIHNTASTPSGSTVVGLRNGGFRFTFNSETARLSVINADYTLTEVAAGDVLSVNNKIGAVTLTASDIEVDPEEGDTNLKDVADDVATLNTNVGTLQDDVGDLQDDVDDLQTTVGGLDTLINTPTETITIAQGTSGEYKITKWANLVMISFEPGTETTTTGTLAPGITLTPVPSGYRPAAKIVGPLYFGTNPPGNFSIATDGTFNAYTASAGTAWMRFGVTYICAGS